MEQKTLRVRARGQRIRDDPGRALDILSFSREIQLRIQGFPKIEENLVRRLKKVKVRNMIEDLLND